MRKRIAVLMAQIDEAMQKSFLNGFISEAYAADFDVCVFSMYQKYQETAMRSSSDANIFELINYDLFDAVLILNDTILTPNFIDKLEAKVKASFNGPVLTVDQDNSLFDSVMMDHYSPFKKIVDHVIEVHGYRDIAFLGGKEGHPHSVQRYKAFVDSMTEHNVEIKDKWIFHGNYWYDSAEEFARILLADKDDFPRAIVCANDIMAIGVASSITEAGYRIPEDVAVTGYDSVEDGRYCPSPLTSVELPVKDRGSYCFKRIEAMLEGNSLSPYKCDAPVLVGGSCGCKYEIELVPKKLRTTWRTQQSSKSMFSEFNHMPEDLMSQSGLLGFLNTLLDYSYQIKPFYSFDIYLNDGFFNPSVFIGENAIRKGYKSKMCRVLSCGENGGVIDLDNSFDTTDMTPLLFEERDYPTTFIFNPLFSEDRCYGYTMINYKDSLEFYDSGFRIWMRDVMLSFEGFYRQRYMLSLIEKIKADQVRDSLTGLYNYDGFLSKIENEVLSDTSSPLKMGIITIDISGIHQINELYGREYGERAIKTVARFIRNTVNENEYCCRMCSDEFLIALEDDEYSSRSLKIISDILDRIRTHQLIINSDYKMKIHYSNLIEETSNIDEFEALINQAISVKNHKKTKASGATTDLMNEVKYNQIVADILNRNLFSYHYQPIVSAVDGSIYAYEALMRCDTEKISPFQIIQSATYLHRLGDVERHTLLNVTSDVINSPERFGEAKVFINSLPGIGLSEEDEREFASRMTSSNGRFVIEFTEESELSDNQLVDIKNKYDRYGCRIAVDDYGAGYSNVNNLLRYMPQYVKIDRMLITGIQKNPQKQHFVKSIIGFAHDNNILALAEGVETSEELHECLKLGVDLIQGYYTGRPSKEPVSQIDPEIRHEIENFKYSNVTWSF